MPTAKTDQSREQKYTVPGVDIDNLSITFDGKADGPGPGHYRSPEEVMIAAANWIWVYAQAAQQLGQSGRGWEWTTYIFSDALTDMYGFTTPLNRKPRPTHARPTFRHSAQDYPTE